MVGRAEGPPGQQGVSRVRQPRHGPDAGGLQRLGAAQLRQNGGQTLCQHGLSCAGRADEQNIMPAGSGDLQRPLHVFLPHDVPHIRQIAGLRLRRPHRSGGKGRFVFQVGYQRTHIRHAINRQSLRQRSLGGVVRRDVQRADTRRLGGQRHGQHTGNAPESAGEAQLTDERGVLGGDGQLTRGGQHTHKNRQIIDRTRLFCSGGGKVHRDAAHRELGTAVFHRRPHPLPGFPHSSVRQTHNIKGRQSAGEKAFRRDLIAGDAGKAQRTDGSDHGVPPKSCSQKFGFLHLISVSHFSHFGNRECVKS